MIDDDDRPVAPGSGVVGRVALGPPNPLGYYKDEEKTARTFRMVNGARHSIPGDFARVEADGSLTLLGRGCACINTAGEKVFPEEVEEALKTHPSVEDALVVGVPDARWGEAVTAVVVLAPGHALDEAGLCATTPASASPATRRPSASSSPTGPLRAANGKADYPAAKAAAAAGAATPAVSSLRSEPPPS